MSKFVKTTKVQAFLRTFSKAAKPASATISIAAGAAGTVKNFYIPTSPITNSNGTDIGGFGDSSFAFATGVFDVEVACNKKDADLANGEYWINYLTGEGRGKKKTAGTSEAITYKYFVPAGGDSAPAVPVVKTPVTIAVGGTAVALAAVSTPFRKALIQAKGANAGSVFLGDSAVTALNGQEMGYLSGIPLPAGDLANYYINGAGDGDGVNILIWN